MKKLIITAMCVCLAITAVAADIPGTNGVPDLTNGGTLTRINLRWAGPLGVFCGSWRPRGQKMTDVRQLQVLAIENGSPADGILKIDDVILGADGTGDDKVPLFEGADWAMVSIGDAITEAEARNPAMLKLLIWRPVKDASDDTERSPESVSLNSVSKMLKPYTRGKTMTVTIELETLGRYSDTAPYNCKKSKKILRKGIKTLYESDDPGKFNMGILCLLAADDPTNPDNDKYQAKAKEWVYRMLTDKGDWGAWRSGVQLIVLSEYYMKTKDEAVFPTLVERAELHARGVSWFGTTGHRWAEKKQDGSYGGRLGGYGPINCSGTQGFLGLSLARKAGVKSPIVDAAIERQRKFFGHWAFKGGIHYGEMPYGISSNPGDRNGVHALAGLALGLQEGDENKTKYFQKKAKYFVGMTALADFHNRLYAHGGPFFGQVWQPVAAGQGGVKTANLRFKEIRWHLDMKRRWDHSRIHDPTHQKYSGFSNAATALLFYALPLKQLYITGRDQRESLQLSGAEFSSVLPAKTFDATKASNQELIDALGQAWGMLRAPAANELTNRIKAKPDDPELAATIEKLLALAADRTAGPTARTGACKVFQNLKNKSGNTEDTTDQKIVKTMVSLLKDPDPYIRFGGVRVLQAFHPSFSQVAIRLYANEILDAVIATGRPTFPLDEEDPVQWAHGEMGILLFGNVLTKNVDGVDRTKLIPAIRSLLKTPNGSARNVTSRVLDKLTMEDVLQLADVIVDNIIVPPPANAMGGTGAPNCQKVLAKYLFEETLPLSALYDNGNGTGVQIAIKNKIPQIFGKSVLSMSSSRQFMHSLGDLMLVKAQDVSSVINDITKGQAPEKLNKLKSIRSAKAAEPTLTLPAAKTELVVDATNYALPGEKATTYTWRKVYGAGKVSFTPNGSGQSKKTTVEFTDKKPGKYRFEVTMSDTLSFNVLRKTVDVTLLGKKGFFSRKSKLPRNNPPQAKSQSLKAVPGLPVSVILSGTDPDGDDLGFIVTKQPAHGRLSGVGGDLSYTADFGYNGIDRFTFNAVDGQGKTAAGTVDFKVSDKNVGVVVYEGFDYTKGAIEGRGGSPSFGFNGPWTNTKGAKDWYLVTDGSLSYPDLPSTGGKAIKGKGWWPLSRPLDPNILSAHKLLDNGRQLWFSVVVGGQKGRQKFFFNLNDGNKDGTAVGFGFDGPDIFATKEGEKAGTSRVGWSRTKHVMFPENAPSMIIGRCQWGKTDKDPDILEIYRVFDAPEFGPMVLEKPVCVVEDIVSQAKINTVSLTDLAGGVDEIRVGPTLHSVMVGTKPLAGKSEKLNE